MRRSDPMIWRALAVVLCLVSASLNFIETPLLPPATDGVIAVAAAGPQRIRVDVAPGSSAARVGMHTGDVVDLGALSPHARWLHGSLRVAGEQLSYPVLRDGHLVTFTTTFARGPTDAVGTLLWLAFAGAAWILAFCVVLVWRRPTDVNVRLLAGALIFWTLGGALWRYNLPLSYPSLAAVLDVLNKVGNGLSIVCLLSYLYRVAPRSRILDLCTALVALAVTCYVALGGIEVYSVFAGAAWLQLNSLPIEQDCYTVALALSALCVVLALPAVPRARRAAVAWAVVPIAYLNFSEAVSVFIIAVSGGIWPQAVVPIAVVYDVGSLLAPLGITYAAFTRRVADIGFALNRAIVFSVVSAIVVGTFALAEWLLGGVIARLTHTENFLVAGAVALVLAFSVRFIHGRVEHVIDRVLFAKRHAAEAALTACAHEAAYIARVDVLLARLEETLYRSTDASSIRVLLRDGATYDGVDENDPAFVTMRARGTMLDLHAVDGSALCGEIAFPLVAGGNVLGAIVLGPRASGESYAPDERAAIANLARSVAHALDVLVRAPSDAALLHDMRGMLDDIRALLTRPG